MRTFPILRHLRSVPPSLLKASPKGEGVHPSQSGTLSTVLAGQKVGVKQVSDRIWLVSFMHYDLGYFDHETCGLEPIENPFTPEKVLTMSPE